MVFLTKWKIFSNWDTMSNDLEKVLILLGQHESDDNRHKCIKNRDGDRSPIWYAPLTQ